MLATGVRTMIGVKVYGDDLNEIQKVSEEVATVLKKVPGAADVFPDQIVGEGYLEINIDREKAARYGVNVGDIQDVVEIGAGRQDDHHHGRRPRAIPRPHSLRPGLPRG